MRTTDVSKLALGHDTQSLMQAGAARVAAQLLADGRGVVTAAALYEHLDQFRLYILSALGEALDSAPPRRMVRKAARG